MSPTPSPVKMEDVVEEEEVEQEVEYEEEEVRQQEVDQKVEQEVTVPQVGSCTHYHTKAPTTTRYKTLCALRMCAKHNLFDE